MQFSLAAKVAAAALIALAIAAFGWHEYKAGEAAGMATVQQKWDRETAQVSQATTVAVTAAASDALANYHAAGDSADVAQGHQAALAVVHDDLTKRVQDYAKQQAGTAGTANGASVGGGAAAGDCGLAADGLRIWNDANAAANGGGAVSASDHPASAAE